ncbi:retrovirus-related pol polyprotein from transposon TNT 1-94 [Tanacetum coccineum]
MSNSNTNLQTQSSNALHNAIMEAGSKDRPPMLAPGNYVQWKSRIKRYIDTKPNRELIHYSLQNPPYIYQWSEKTVLVAEDQMNAEAEAVQIILTGIDNDIYSTVDACPNACEMWKSSLKESKLKTRAINVAGARENVGTPVVQKSGIQCYNCKEYGHVLRECQKPKRVKDATYHKEKMLLFKHEEARGSVGNARTRCWKDDMMMSLKNRNGRHLFTCTNT